MKTISNDLKAHLAEGATTLATILEINRRDGEDFYFTSREDGFTYNSNYYEPYTGYAPSALETKINMSVDNQSLIGVLDSDSISQEDIRAGLFDFADVKLSIVNYKDFGMGEMAMLAGKFGETTIEGNQFTIELRGMAQLLQQKMGELYLPSCAAIFGDSRCKLNAADAAYTKSFTVSALIVDEERRTFQTSDLVDDDAYFDGGLLTFNDAAANPDAVMDVKKYLKSNGRIELYEPLPYDIQVGDAGSVIVGCPKSLSACKTKFAASNIVNFRGFPHLIGATSALRGV